MKIWAKLRRCVKLLALYIVVAVVAAYIFHYVESSAEIKVCNDVTKKFDLVKQANEKHIENTLLHKRETGDQVEMSNGDTIGLSF